MNIFMILDNGWKIGNHNAQHIQHNEMYIAQTSKYFLKDVFQLGSKKIEREHVKDQVHVIAMNKTRS